MSAGNKVWSELALGPAKGPFVPSTGKVLIAATHSQWIRLGWLRRTVVLGEGVRGTNMGFLWPLKAAIKTWGAVGATITYRFPVLSSRCHRHIQIPSFEKADLTIQGSSRAGSPGRPLSSDQRHLLQGLGTAQLGTRCSGPARVRCASGSAVLGQACGAREGPGAYGARASDRGYFGSFGKFKWLGDRKECLGSGSWGT